MHGVGFRTVIEPHHLPIGSAPGAGERDRMPAITNESIGIVVPNLAITRLGMLFELIYPRVAKGLGYGKRLSHGSLPLFQAARKSRQHTGSALSRCAR